jgi:hypothetical protein
MIIIYVCHDQQSVDNCIKKDPDSYIFLVGPAEIKNNSNKIIVARNLPHNIESERKLLTFTAWYAIIKNKLFLEQTHLCILECDTTIPSLNKYTNINEDIGAFFTDGGTCFQYDINYSVLLEFIKKKNITYETPTRPWNCTTNYIIKRTLLEKFVDFYYPDCLTYIKTHDIKRFSWYHERIFWVFLVENKASILKIPGAIHLQSGSHMNNKIN